MTIYKCIQQSINYVVPPIAITSFSIDTHWCSQYIYYIIKDTASNICSSLDWARWMMEKVFGNLLHKNEILKMETVLYHYVEYFQPYIVKGN